MGSCASVAENQTLDTTASRSYNNNDPASVDDDGSKKNSKSKSKNKNNKGIVGKSKKEAAASVSSSVSASVASVATDDHYNNGNGNSNSIERRRRRNRRNRFVLYSDFTCPYCYLEFVRLTRAMERLPKTMRMDIGHGAFQLDESLPREGVDKYGFLSKLIPPEVLDPMIDILCEQFEDLNMEEMNRSGLLGNSALAHRLQIWAETNLTRTRSLALKDELFKIHSIKGRSMGDVDAIIEAAASAGLTDESLVRSVLKDPKYIDRFKKQKKRARETYGIESVPCLVLIEANTGKHRILDDATGIETVDGFSDLIAKHL